jgi:hypothetical protein
MQYLDEPFGEVNTIYTYCTFIALTGGTPKFGPGVFDYCKNDYQGHGQIYNFTDNLRGFEEDEIPGKYLLVPEAAILLL